MAASLVELFAHIDCICVVLYEYYTFYPAMFLGWDFNLIASKFCEECFRQFGTLIFLSGLNE